MAGSTSLVRAPRRDLAPFVSEINMVASSDVGSERAVEHLPDGKVSMLFRLTAAGGDVSVSGPRRIARYKKVRALPLYVAISFHPGGASPFLGAPLGLLVDRIVTLDELWGKDVAARLVDALSAAPAADAAVDRFEAALVDRLRSRPSADSPMASLARRAARVLCDSDGAAPSIAVIAAQVGVSERHLRRMFVDVVGVTPKELARMRRLHRAFDRRERAQASWSEIAAASGFFDQSHLIADARALLQMTPEAFVARHALTPTPYVSC